jgi:hypothetical protein
MTINKIALSAVTSAVLATSVLGGTLTVTSQSVGAESVAADRYFNNIDLNATFVPNIQGSLTSGSITYDFTNVDINSSAVSTLGVWKSANASGTLNTRLQYANSCTRTSATRLTCDLNGTINSGDSLILADDNTSEGFELMDVNTSAGFTGSTIAVTLVNNALTTVDTGSAVNYLTTTTEWSATSSGFANQIDASNSFLSFTSASDANATVTISQSSPDIASPAGTINWSVLPDQNATAFGAMTMTGGAVTQGSDYNYTCADTTLAAKTLNADFTPDGTNAIQEATFTTGLTMTLNGTTSNLIAAGTDFGSFTTYGYTAQIPGASYSSAAGTETTITIVNTGASSSTHAYVTIQDATGNSCTIDSSANSSVAQPTAGTSNKYKLSEMLAETACSALTGTSYSIELSVPTTPTNIYSNAFVKNSTINQFKVLPVYNNGNSY